MDNKPSILIVGCGSLGSHLVSHFKAVAQVACFDIDRQVVRRLQKSIRITDKIKDYKGHNFDLTIMATKCNDMRAAVKDCAGSCRPKAVLFVQNGSFSLGWASRLFSDAEFYRGVTTSAIQASRSGGIEVFLRGTFFMGSYAGGRRSLPWMLRSFRKSGLRTVVLEDYRSAVWAKLIFSSVMNPLPILTGSNYGIIRKDPGVNRLVREAIDEGKRVAAKMHIPLAFDPMHIVRRLQSGNLGDFRYKGSMYYDFINARPLELDFITGELVRQARRLSIQTPVLDTIYAMTAAMEKIRDSQR